MDQSVRPTTYLLDGPYASGSRLKSLTCQDGFTKEADLPVYGFLTH